jgi:hypothetical protein
MSLLIWVIGFALISLFSIWVLFFGGDGWLEQSSLSWLLVDWRATFWSADSIKFYVGATWVLSGVWFVMGLFWPQVRLLGWWW